jgi:hypothetical protein
MCVGASLKKPGKIETPKMKSGDEPAQLIDRNRDEMRPTTNCAKNWIAWEAVRV